MNAAIVIRLSNICRHILGINYVNAASVTRLWYRKVNLKYIYGYRLGRHHSYATIVTRFSHKI